MNLVFLSANFVPQHVCFIEELIAQYGVDIHAFHLSRNFAYVPEGIVGLHTYKKDELSKETIVERILALKPELLYVAGYGEKDFLWIAKQIRAKLNIPIVSGCDTQWRSTFKQGLLSKLARWVIRPAFTHFMVAGVYQYEWARKLGYRKDQIIFNLYSGDTKAFAEIPALADRSAIQKNFIFVGRLVSVKGLDVLLEAWDSLTDKQGWTLTLVGEGPLKSQCEGREDVILKGYLKQPELIQLASESACFVLPSNFEPWGVVVHEFAAAGLPLICTDTCGATPHFLINNYNGFAIPANDVSALSNALNQVIQSSDATLATWGGRSRQAGLSINQEMSAASLMGVLSREDVF